MPKGGMYVYSRVPLEFQGCSFDSAMSFTQFLLETHGIATVPWEEPEPSIRFALTFEVGGKDFSSEEEVYALLKERLVG